MTDITLPNDRNRYDIYVYRIRQKHVTIFFLKWVNFTFFITYRMRPTQKPVLCTESNPRPLAKLTLYKQVINNKIIIAYSHNNFVWKCSRKLRDYLLLFQKIFFLNSRVNLISNIVFKINLIGFPYFKTPFNKRYALRTWFLMILQ